MKSTCLTVALAVVLMFQNQSIGQNNNTQQFNNQQQGGNVQQTNPTNGGGVVPQTQNNSSQQLVPQQPQQPAWYPLPAEHDKYVDSVLDYWANESNKIERLQSKFRRWDYNPAFCAHRDPTNMQLSAFRVVDGVVKYAQPDKGMYEATNIWEFTPPKAPDQKPDYAEVKDQADRDQQLEKWICDGKKIFAFDFASKQLQEMELPPEMQGRGLANSPLPFLFGVQSAQLKQRYWIRPVTPNGAEGQYWLEAWPKNREDAQQYKFVRVIIAQADFLPESIQVYAPNYDERTNPTFMAISFHERQKNQSIIINKINPFYNEFYEPKTPFGWTRKTGRVNNAQPLDPNSPEFRAMQEQNGTGIR